MAEKETAAPWKLPYPTSAGEVKLGATDFEELAERLTTILKEHVLTITKHTASYEAKSGELGEVTKTAQTVTLPLAATKDQIVGIFSTVAETKVTTSGGAEVFGDFIVGATFTLSTNQHVVLQANGTNWLVIAGEPKRGATYTALAASTINAKHLVSATRPSVVLLTVYNVLGSPIVEAKILVGATQIGLIALTEEAVRYWSVTLHLEPGDEWELAANAIFRVSESHKIL